MQHTSEAAGDIVDAILATATPSEMAAGPAAGVQKRASLEQLAYAFDADGRVAMAVATKQVVLLHPRAIGLISCGYYYCRCYYMTFTFTD